MKWLTFISLLLILFAFQTTNPCDPKQLKDAVREVMSPYQYDLSKLNRFTYKNKPQLKELEVDLFIGEKYKLIFNTTGCPIPITIHLYNRDKDHSKRKLLYSSKDEPSDKKIFTFEYSKARHIYIDYEIPADTTNSNLQGCVMFVLGYK